MRSPPPPDFSGGKRGKGGSLPLGLPVGRRKDEIWTLEMGFCAENFISSRKGGGGLSRLQSHHFKNLKAANHCSVSTHASWQCFCTKKQNFNKMVVINNYICILKYTGRILVRLFFFFRKLPSPILDIKLSDVPSSP